MVASCPVVPLVVEGGRGDLFALLDGLPDPRRTGWRRHPLGYVLAVVSSAFAGPGFDHLAGAAQWAGDRTREERLASGGRVDAFTRIVLAPGEATIRAVLKGLDPAASTAACVAWTPAHRGTDTGTGVEGGGARAADRLRALAMDGKCVRGARRADGPVPQLTAALTHRRPVVVAQTQVPDKTSEIAAVATLLDDLGQAGWDPGSTVTTLDALHTVRATATRITDTGTDYVMTVKGNRALLYEQCAAACTTPGPDTQISPGTRTDRGHGRTEERTVKAVTVSDGDGLDLPGAAQVFAIVRHTGGLDGLDGQRTTKEVVHAITSPTRDQADAATLSDLVRGHRQIENAPHHVPDVTFAEDASRARTGNLPAVLATIRGTVIAAPRLTGATNTAQARRWAAATPQRTTALHGANPNPDKRTL